MSDKHPFFKFTKHLKQGPGIKKVSHTSEQIVNPDVYVTYKINKYGFRTKDWTDNKEECYVALGCSHTYGQGVPEDSRWSNLLEQHTGVTIYNLGLGAGSRDTITRLMIGWLEEIKPSKIFVLWPGEHRWEVGLRDRIKSYTPSTVHSIVNREPNRWDSGYILEYLGQEYNAEVNKIRNDYTFKGLCEEHNIEPYTLKYSDFQNIDCKTARDGIHNGVLFHKAIADEFIKTLDK